MRSSGWHHTKATRAKISKAGMGKTRSDETRKRMSKARLGKPLSIERRMKISAGLKGTHNFLGHVVTRETRAKISASMKGPLAHRWKGGTWKSHGYLYIYKPGHPQATPRGYVRENRLVMERHLGRLLLPGEVVHHINGNPSDNRIENLRLFSSNVAHMNFHKKERHQ